MQRRELLRLGLGAAIWPLAARAQQSPHVARIGVLVIGSPDPEPLRRQLRDDFRDLGYREGENIVFEFRSAEGKLSRLPELAADLVRLHVDVIVTWQTPPTHAAKQATHDIPIVMADSGDPVGTGLVASLAKPGGNITGIAGMTAELAGKSVDLIRELLPSAHRVAALCNVIDPFSKPFLEKIQLAASAVQIDIQPYNFHGGEELEAGFLQVRRDRPDAVIVQPSLPSRRAAELAIESRLPAVSVPRFFAEEGGLLSYSQRLPDLYRRAAVYVDRILKGAKPADLPVQQPTNFELVVNLRTARAIGVTVPPSLLARADDVIE